MLSLYKMEQGCIELPGIQVPWLFTPSDHIYLLEVPSALSKVDSRLSQEPRRVLDVCGDELLRKETKEERGRMLRNCLPPTHTSGRKR